MSEKNNLEQKIAEVDEILRAIESGKVSLGEVSAKYREALKKIQEINQSFDQMKNEIEILTQDFSK